MELDARSTRGPRPGRAQLAITLVAAWLALAVTLGGCPPGPNGNPDGGDAGPPPDLCNDREEALSSPECELPLDGGFLRRYISTPGDVDWYRISLPSGLNARSLVRVVGGYSVPATAVNLSVNLLTEDGQNSLVRGIDRHGAGAPRPVDLVVPYSGPDSRLVALVGDEAANPARPNYDFRAWYEIRAELRVDPDENEPNNTSAAAINIPLSPMGALLTGTGGGQLTTTDDVDYNTINDPAPAGTRKLMYLRITAPELSPPPPYRLSYTLYRPDGSALSEDTVLNEFIAVDLATSRLTVAGRYTLAIQAYHSPTRPGPVAGDLRPQARYTVQVMILDEQDTHEPNDTRATAMVISLPGPDGTRRSYTGRLDHVPDVDWYAFDLPPTGSPTLLNYRLVPTTTGGRFPALPGEKDRQLRVFTTVETAGSTQAQRVQQCLNDRAVCPRDTEVAPGLPDELNAYCNQDPPHCMRAYREEAAYLPAFANLKNFEGVLQILPSTTARRYYVAVQDLGNDFADDLDYRLEIQWSQDPDEAARFSGSTEQTAAYPLNVDTGTSFPTPPGSATTLSGTLSHGYGRTTRFEPGDPGSVRGPSDYDAIPTDVDRYQLNLPGTDPWSGGPDDRSWELQWSVDHLDGGYVHDLKLLLTFCDGDRLDGGACSLVSTSNRGTPLILAYWPDPVRGWHNASRWQPLYDRTVTPTEETVTARAFGCFCIEPRFRRGGRFYLDVIADDRSSYAPVQYTLKTAYTSYPRSFDGGLSDGGAALCPAPTQIDAGTPDGGPVPPPTYAPGCRFTFE